jgi:hypothetical protein
MDEFYIIKCIPVQFFDLKNGAGKKTKESSLVLGKHMEAIWRPERKPYTRREGGGGARGLSATRWFIGRKRNQVPFPPPPKCTPEADNKTRVIYTVTPSL